LRVCISQPKKKKKEKKNKHLQTKTSV